MDVRKSYGTIATRFWPLSMQIPLKSIGCCRIVACSAHAAFGLGIVVASIGLHAGGPLPFVLFSTSAAGLLLLISAFVFHLRILPDYSDLHRVFISSFIFCIGQLCFFIGLKQGNPLTVSTWQSSFWILATSATVIFERSSRLGHTTWHNRYVLLAVAAAIGCIVMAAIADYAEGWGEMPAVLFRTHLFVGVGLLTCHIWLAMALNLLRKYAVLTVTAWTFLVSGAILAAVFLASKWNQDGPLAYIIFSATCADVAPPGADGTISAVSEAVCQRVALDIPEAMQLSLCFQALAMCLVAWPLTVWGCDVQRRMDPTTVAVCSIAQPMVTVAAMVAASWLMGKSWAKRHGIVQPTLQHGEAILIVLFGTVLLILDSASQNEEATDSKPILQNVAITKDVEAGKPQSRPPPIGAETQWNNHEYAPSPVVAAPRESAEEVAAPAVARWPPGKGKVPPPPAAPKAKAKAKAKTSDGPRASHVPPSWRRLHWKELSAERTHDTIFEELQPWGTGGFFGTRAAPLDTGSIDQLLATYKPSSMPLADGKDTNEKKRNTIGPIASTRTATNGLAGLIAEPHALAKVAAKGPDGKICLLEDFRAQNLAIVLRQVAVPLSELAELLGNMDTSSPMMPEEFEHVSDNLLPHLQSSDALMNYDGRVDDLRRLEQQLLPVARVPRLKVRIRAMIFAKNMGGIRKKISCRIVRLAEASSEVAVSETLKRVFAVVLQVGSYLNHGVDPACAGSSNVIGFTMDSLLKLRDYRSSDSASSALHCVVLHLARECPGLLAQMKEELQHAIGGGDIPSAGTSMGDLRDELSQLKEEIKSAQEEMDACLGERSAGSCNEKTIVNLQRLLDDATNVQKVLEAEVDELLLVTVHALRYYGERVDRLRKREDSLSSGEKFFVTICGFIAAFEECWNELAEIAQPRTWIRT